ncbi:MAG: sulfite exporter TauE/SafE family protein [Hydrogenovibrio sp.]
MLIELLIYVLTGIVAGFFAGLLGIGGGLIIIPILSSVFLHFLDTPHLVHLAIGTSMATILITAIASTRAHQKHKAIRWDIVKSLTPGILVGGFLGGWISQYFNASMLAQIFAVIEIAIALQMLLNIQPSPNRELPGLVGRTTAGTLIGALSSLVGIGGGALNTPYLVWHNVTVRQAIATSAACSLPVAAAGTLGFLVAGWNATQLPEYATGYIYWPAFFGIVIASFLVVPFGASLTHKLPVHQLKRVFGLLLIGLAIKMIWF